MRAPVNETVSAKVIIGLSEILVPECVTVVTSIM